MIIRHPEKINNPINPIKKKPNWIRTKILNTQNYFETNTIINKKKLHTVCKEANCPNITECWSKKHATFMIMGDICTRACAFCNIKTGRPGIVDKDEPQKIAKTVFELGLKHVVVTSVDRDDLEDGGASHFFQCVEEIKKLDNKVTIELLVPDFQRKKNALNIIAECGLDVFNHNLETIPRLYKEIRRGADYSHSLNILKKIKSLNNDIWTKSGLMVGLGENINEIFDVMHDMRENNVDFITIGQYLQPSKKHIPVIKFVEPDKFSVLKEKGLSLGFTVVESGPLVRSSYHAEKHLF